MGRTTVSCSLNALCPSSRSRARYRHIVPKISIIQAHNASRPLYLYLAFHNVHDSCNVDGNGVLNAPKASVELYSTTELDTWKVQGAMTTELDYGVGNVTAALKVRRASDI